MPCTTDAIMDYRLEKAPSEYVGMERAKDRLTDIHSAKATVHAKPAAVGALEFDPQ